MSRTERSKFKGTPSVVGIAPGLVNECCGRGFKEREIASWRLSCLSPLQFGRLRRPSTLREKEALDIVRGRQGLVESQQDVWDVSIRFAAYRSGVLKGRTLPLRMWVVRPQMNDG